MIPEPVTPPEHDSGRRAQSTYDLEVTLVGFIKRLVTPYLFDNPTVNLAQPTFEPVIEQPIAHDPDDPPVSYDPRERAQTLALKVVPRVERARIPRTVTGEIEVSKLSDHPSISVQAVAAKVQNDVTIVTVRICVNIYDEAPDSGGYQDCVNLCDAISYALTSYGQQAIDKAYPIVMPFTWKLLEADTFPHYIAEMETQWELPSARPLPDPEMGFAPVDQITFTPDFR